MTKKLTCDAHGKVAWRGDVVCARDAGGCGRVYQTRDSKLSSFAPYDCACGAPLMPVRPVDDPQHKDEGRREHFTARSICPGCFDARSAQQQA